MNISDVLSFIGITIGVVLFGVAVAFGCYLAYDYYKERKLKKALPKDANGKIDINELKKLDGVLDGGNLKISKKEEQEDNARDFTKFREYEKLRTFGTGEARTELPKTERSLIGRDKLQDDSIGSVKPTEQSNSRHQQNDIRLNSTTKESGKSDLRHFI